MTAPVDYRALIHRILALPEEYRLQLIRSLNAARRREFNERWAVWAHEGQLIGGTGWRVALIRAGRGFGKTRAGAEWVSEIARTRSDARIALVGGTIDDVRRVISKATAGC